MKYIYRRRIAFHETDPMGVLHHANYIRIFEEARVDWLRSLGLLHFHQPVGDLAFAVIDLRAKYLRPVAFDAEVEVHVALRMKGIRMIFDYELQVDGETSALAEVTLAPLDPALRPTRLPDDLKIVLQKHARA